MSAMALDMERESQKLARRARDLRRAEVRRNQPPPEPIWLTIDEAAALLNVSHSTIYRLSKLPGFPISRSPRMTRIHRQQLLEWADLYFAARQSGRPFEPSPRPRRRKP